jgi:hypothetical protein
MQNSFVQAVEFKSKLNGQSWMLANIYAPCSPEGKLEFLSWFKGICVPDDQSWIFLWNFNLICKPENRNKPGGDLNLMMAFNEPISALGILEIPMHGQSYTWSNMQQKPLLEKLDCIFFPRHGLYSS